MKNLNIKTSAKESIREYKKILKKPLRPRTITLLLKKDKVLLGLKIKGFGKGNYIGIGGKIEEEKDRIEATQDVLSVIKSGAKREIQEEIGVNVVSSDLRPMGVLNFYFPSISDESWNQTVYVFVTEKWTGKPIAAADGKGEIEVRPDWFDFEKLPLSAMWDDAKYWLPQVLKGDSVHIDFLFDENLKVIDSVSNE